MFVEVEAVHMRQLFIWVVESIKLLGGRRLHPVCTENSNSDIMVMQSAEDRVGMDTSSSLNWARERRVLI